MSMDSTLTTNIKRNSNNLNLSVLKNNQNTHKSRGGVYQSIDMNQVKNRRNSGSLDLHISPTDYSSHHQDEKTLSIEKDWKLNSKNRHSYNFPQGTLQIAKQNQKNRVNLVNKSVDISSQQQKYYSLESNNNTSDYIISHSNTKSIGIKEIYKAYKTNQQEQNRNNYISINSRITNNKHNYHSVEMSPTVTKNLTQNDGKLVYDSRVLQVRQQSKDPTKYFMTQINTPAPYKTTLNQSELAGNGKFSGTNVETSIGDLNEYLSNLKNFNKKQLEKLDLKTQSRINTYSNIAGPYGVFTELNSAIDASKLDRLNQIQKTQSKNSNHPAVLKTIDQKQSQQKHKSHKSRIEQDNMTLNKKEDLKQKEKLRVSQAEVQKFMNNMQFEVQNQKMTQFRCPSLDNRSSYIQNSPQQSPQQSAKVQGATFLTGKQFKLFYL
eukprot:403373551